MLPTSKAQMTQVIIWTVYPRKTSRQITIVGAEVYQYGENIVVGIGGKYWLYENYHSTDLDGNPDGYDPLPNNQTSAEEVSEQDPAAN